jgi:polyvinyl alcohol dehydrogenase (cytochrome)
MGKFKRVFPSRAGLGGAVASGIIVSLTSVAFAQGTGQWTMGGEDLNNSRNQSLGTITPVNVANLKPKWVFTTGGDVTATPAVVGNTVDFPDFAGNYYAVNAQTGAAVWSQTVSTWTGVANDYARNDPAFDNQTLFLGDQAGLLATVSSTGTLVGAGARVIAVTAATGVVKWVTQVESFPAAAVTGSPVIYNGVVYVGIADGEEFAATNPSYHCCAQSGEVVALDEKTGRILWKTTTVPAGFSGGSIWDSTPVIDPVRNSIYVGTGNNFSVPASVTTCLTNNQNNPLCLPSNDYIDSALALDLTTGVIKWGTRAVIFDTWNVACAVGFAPGTGNCPSPAGPDYDFGGAGPNMLGPNMVGFGQKSGLYWAVNANTGAVVWKTQVGPGSSLGGIEWGSAFDGTSIYAPIGNLYGIPYALANGGPTVNGGSWAALNPTTGAFVWQTATPGACSASIPGVEQGCLALSPASAANGVVFAGSMDTNPANPTMFALSASTGNVLWSYAAGSSVIAGPAIAGDSVYWGAGYRRFGPSLGTGNNKLFAFSVHQGGK